MCEGATSSRAWPNNRREALVGKEWQVTDEEKALVKEAVARSILELWRVSRRFASENGAAGLWRTTEANVYAASLLADMFRNLIGKEPEEP
jgi:hypothetical protein